ncbi:hypothetical protein JCM11641_004168 [Rhodosporidiobolus odoratus]
MSASPAPPQPEASTSSAGLAPVAAAAKKALPPPKAVNIFTSDGSFLERMKATKTISTADKEKEEREKALVRKKAMEDRFKKRGKRAAESADGSAAKKKKDDDSGLTEYEKEVKRLESRTLKDSGYDMRPMLK